MKKILYLPIIIYNKVTMKNYIKNLNGLNIKYILLSLISAIISASGVAIFGVNNFDINNLYLSFALMLGVIYFLFSGRKLYNKKVKNIKSLPFGEKLNAYQKATKVKVFSFNMISIIACIGLIFSGNWMYLVFVVFAIMLIALNWASVQKLKIELSLTDKELKIIQGEKL